MARKKERIDTGGGHNLNVDNPFAAIESGIAVTKPAVPTQPKPVTAGKRAKPKETLLLRRLKSGKGGKVVTEISGFDADPATMDRLLKQLQGKLATGGTRKGKVLELQGELRERLKPILEAIGYRVKGA